MQEQANRNDIQLRRVRRDDWDWIQEWFQDDWLNNELGPLDETWLEHVLGENDGVELIVEEHGNPVAIIGILWDTNKNPLNVVTSIAVNPNLRRRGRIRHSTFLLILTARQLGVLRQHLFSNFLYPLRIYSKNKHLKTSQVQPLRLRQH